jgi:hypothetical protein
MTATTHNTNVILYNPINIICPIGDINDIPTVPITPNIMAMVMSNDFLFIFFIYVYLLLDVISIMFSP